MLKRHINIQNILHGQAKRGDALLVIGKKDSPVKLKLPDNFSQVRFTSLLCEESNDCKIQPDRLNFLLKHNSQNHSEARFTKDYRICFWKGHVYKMTPTQALVFKKICESSGIVHKDNLLAHTSSECDIKKVMRNRKNNKWVTHPLLGTLLTSNGDGFYWLNEDADPLVNPGV